VVRPAELLSLLRGIRADAPYGDRRLARCHSIGDLAERARRRLPRAARSYLEGGGEDEYTLRRNRSAFDELELVPQVLRDVSDVDVSTTVLGQRLPAPIALAPIGAPRFVHHEGELAVARAAAAVGVPHAISTVGSVALEEVARTGDATFWLQLYLWGDREAARRLVDRGRQLGFRALLLTADVSVRSKRERELHAGLTLPNPEPTVRTILEAARHPWWTWSFLTKPMPTFPNVSPPGAGADESWDLSALFDGTVCWDDIAWIRERWEGPVVLKGVLNPDDARRAADAGVDAVVVSNHGGRQLDHVPAAIAALPAVVDAVGDRVEVLFDSGVRRGTDILTALALGARAVLVGRAHLYGLAAAGSVGVRYALDILVDELERAMALTGVRRVDELHPGLVRRRTADAAP
jgi:L-lactate dehydrogenase (cytochrome)